MDLFQHFSKSPNRPKMTKEYLFKKKQNEGAEMGDHNSRVNHSTFYIEWNVIN